MGTGNTVGPFAVITGPVEIGNDNWFGTGAIVGAPPEVRSWAHPGDAQAMSSGNGVHIGDGNVLREYVQIHQGWRGTTRLGSGAFLMNQTYVAHDVTVGDNVTLASSVLLAGHVDIGEGANLGLGVSVHQGVFVGAGAMIGMGGVVVADIPPFVKAYGNPARPRGVNSVGMQRRGIAQTVIDTMSAVDPALWNDDVFRGFAASSDVGPVFAGWLARR